MTEREQIRRLRARHESLCHVACCALLRGEYSFSEEVFHQADEVRVAIEGIESQARTDRIEAHRAAMCRGAAMVITGRVR